MNKTPNLEDFLNSRLIDNTFRGVYTLVDGSKRVIIQNSLSLSFCHTWDLKELIGVALVESNGTIYSLSVNTYKQLILTPF